MNANNIRRNDFIYHLGYGKLLPLSSMQGHVDNNNFDSITQATNVGIHILPNLCRHNIQKNTLYNNIHRTRYDLFGV